MEVCARDDKVRSLRLWLCEQCSSVSHELNFRELFVKIIVLLVTACFSVTGLAQQDSQVAIDFWKRNIQSFADESSRLISNQTVQEHVSKEILRLSSDSDFRRASVGGADMIGVTAGLSGSLDASIRRVVMIGDNYVEDLVYCIPVKITYEDDVEFSATIKCTDYFAHR